MRWPLGREQLGSIPALRGATEPCGHDPQTVFRVHPRPPGVVLRASAASPPALGSSPPARGHRMTCCRRQELDRFIPACAGPPTARAPRVQPCSGPLQAECMRVNHTHARPTAAGLPTHREGSIELHSTGLCNGRSTSADPSSTVATTLKPSSREPLHERLRETRRTGTLHCAHQARGPLAAEVRGQTLAETQTTPAKHQRCGVVSTQAATRPVLQATQFRRPRRVNEPNLDTLPPGLPFHHGRHLARPERRQRLGETPPVRL